MDQQWQWIIGTALTFFLSYTGMLVAALWKVIGMIKSAELQQRSDSEHLHERVNRVREEHVKKSDLDGHITRLAQDMRDMRVEQREATKTTNDRLDALISALANKGGV